MTTIYEKSTQRRPFIDFKCRSITEINALIQSIFTKTDHVLNIILTTYDQNQTHPNSLLTFLWVQILEFNIFLQSLSSNKSNTILLYCCCHCLRVTSIMYSNQECMKFAEIDVEMALKSVSGALLFLDPELTQNRHRNISLPHHLRAAVQHYWSDIRSFNSKSMSKSSRFLVDRKNEELFHETLRTSNWNSAQELQTYQSHLDSKFSFLKMRLQSMNFRLKIDVEH